MGSSQEMTVQFERPGLARQRIADELRDRIIAGRLAPAQRVGQEQVAAEFGTSQGPAREAFRTLAGEGFLTHENHRGYRVVTVSPSDAEQVRQIRDILEPHALRLAVPRMGPPECAAIERRHRELSAVLDAEPSAFGRALRAFHFEIFSCARSPRLVTMLRTQWQHAQRIRSATVRDATGRSAYPVEWHDSLLAACLGGDAEAAVTSMWEYRHRDVDATAETAPTSRNEASRPAAPAAADAGPAG